jgi:signal transduction histidine kinase/DNA-binding response OmpR family regulator
MNCMGLFIFRFIIVCFLIFFATSYICYAQIIRIPEQYSSIQKAIDEARKGDTLLINEGRYFESISFKGKAITVGSYYLVDGDTSHISKTIIDGSRSGKKDLYSTVYMNSGEDTLSVIKGLTITGGRGSLFYVGDAGHWGGGGILVFDCGGKIESNIIEGNTLSYELVVNTGAGIMAGIKNGYNFILRNNIIRDNTIRTVQQADAGGIIVAGNHDSFVLIEKNQIIRNSARSSGPNSAHGGGISIFCNIPFRNKIIVRKNTIAHNEADSNPGSGNLKAYGGGINVIYIEINPEFQSKEIPIIISDNDVHHNVSREWGGGLSFFRVNTSYITRPDCPAALVIGNRIIDNASMNGAGLANINTSIVLINNTFNNISSRDSADEIFNRDVTYQFINSGIVNLFDNDIQCAWKNEKNIFYDNFPIVHTFSHSWRVTEYSDEGIKFNLIPPLWRRWWAFSTYAIILLIGLLAYRKYLIQRISLKLSLENERKEVENIREMERMKSRFFANISHEFRTPLALIFGPVNDVIQKEKISEKSQKNLQYVKKSVESLQHLVNQLLDLSKLESGTVKLEVCPGNLNEFISRILASFLSLAESKKINFQYNLTENFVDVLFDSDKLEKILNNLLSNAFKFTPEGGEVTFNLSFSETDTPGFSHYIVFTVSDTGPGMSKEESDRIFDRFYSKISAHKGSMTGTGIGLSIVKELVDIYRGSVHVKTSPGQGTAISVRLPVSKDVFSSDEIHSFSLPQTAFPEIQNQDKTVIEADSSPANDYVNHPKDSPVILVVEDNKDLRNYIVSLLDNDAIIIEAENGKDASMMAIEKIPDLIISDLMMPVMDGVELIQFLKKDERTCHIPFIMLTARGDLESKLESLENGVDDYMGKPFYPEELKARVANIIVQRQLLKGHYKKEFLQDPDFYINGESGEKFMDKVVQLIKENLSNPEFNVESLSDALHVSRLQLYRKITAMTGFSPVSFIRNIRLKVASKMFSESELNVTQVMLEVGFSSPSYFTECFRELFGCNPSEYIKRTREGSSYT